MTNYDKLRLANENVKAATAEYLAVEAEFNDAHKRRGAASSNAQRARDELELALDAWSKEPDA